MKPQRTLMLALLIAALGTLSACNTVAGFGRDVQKVGEKVEDSARRK